jgi:hypothetical protein
MSCLADHLKRREAREEPERLEHPADRMKRLIAERKEAQAKRRGRA